MIKRIHWTNMWVTMDRENGDINFKRVWSKINQGNAIDLWHLEWLSFIWGGAKVGSIYYLLLHTDSEITPSSLWDRKNARNWILSAAWVASHLLGISFWS